MPDFDVFISYARRTSRVPANALATALTEADIEVYIDEDKIGDGEQFPQSLVDALLGARVCVILLDQVYLTRWYCWRELELALAPFREHVRLGSPERDRKEALDGVVVALPINGAWPSRIDRIPRQLLNTQWPTARDTDRLVELVRASLQTCAVTIGDRLDTVGFSGHWRDSLLGRAALPPTRSLRGETPLVPVKLATPIGERFVGRADELWFLYSLLAPLPAGDDPAPAGSTVSIEGGPGLGKSRLAKEFLWRFGHEYSGGLFWVSADIDDAVLEQRHYEIAHAVDPELDALATLRRTERDVAEALAARLRAVPPERPILFVIDNLPLPQQNTPPPDLSRWCPALGHAHVLVTSQWRISLASPSVVPLGLKPLQPESAIRLLNHDLAHPLIDEEAHEVVEWVGRLPIALEVIHKAVALQAISRKELVERARSGSPAQQIENLAEIGDMPSVTDAFLMSYERLSKPAQAAARQLAWLAPEPIPMELVEALEIPGNARAEIVERSFVTVASPAVDVESFGHVHQLMAAVLQRQSTGDEIPNLVNVLKEAVSRKATQTPQTWPLLSACVPHVESLVDHSARFDVASAVNLRLRLGTLFCALGLDERARDVEEIALGIARSELGDEHEMTVLSMNSLAVTLRELDDLEPARDLQQEAIDLCARMRECPDHVALMLVDNLGLVFKAMKEFERAEKLHKQALDGKRQLRGSDHRSTLTSMNNLAETWREMKRFEPALDLHQQALDDRRRVLGTTDLDTMTSEHNLAMTLRDMDDCERAIEHFENAFEHRRRVLGADHPDTLESKQRLAETEAERN